MDEKFIGRDIFLTELFFYIGYLIAGSFDGVFDKLIADGMCHGNGYHTLFQIYNGRGSVDGVDGLHHVVYAILAAHSLYGDRLFADYRIQLFPVRFVGASAAAAALPVEMPDAGTQGKTEDHSQDRCNNKITHRDSPFYRMASLYSL